MHILTALRLSTSLQSLLSIALRNRCTSRDHYHLGAQGALYLEATNRNHTIVKPVQRLPVLEAGHAGAVYFSKAEAAVSG
jgi:hypothetical protein